MEDESAKKNEATVEEKLRALTPLTIKDVKAYAKKLYEKALGLEANHQVALVNLAKIYYRLGKKETSRSYLERALKLGLSKTQSNDLAQLLKKLSTL